MSLGLVGAGRRVLRDRDDDVSVQDLAGLDEDRPLPPRAARLCEEGVAAWRKQKREPRVACVLFRDDAVARADHVRASVLREAAAWSRPAAQADQPGHSSAGRRCSAAGAGPEQYGKGPQQDRDAPHATNIRLTLPRITN